jgi:hypothetical protein
VLDGYQDGTLVGPGTKELTRVVCSKVDAQPAFLFTGEMKNKKLKIQVFLEVFYHHQK